MAYKTSDLKKKAIAAIEKYKLIFIDEIASYLPCNRATFYNHKLDKLDSIKELLDENKDKIKSSLRSKWYKTDNATLQLALMRLICTDKERRKLAINYSEISGIDGERLIPITNILIERSNIKSNGSAGKAPELNGKDKIIKGGE